MVCNSLNRFGLPCKGLEITQSGFCKDHATIPASVVEVPVVEVPALVPTTIIEAPMYQCKSQTIAKKQCKLRATVDGFCSRHSTTNPSTKCQALTIAMKPCRNNAKIGTQYCGVHSFSVSMTREDILRLAPFPGVFGRIRQDEEIAYEFVKCTYSLINKVYPQFRSERVYDAALGKDGHIIEIPYENQTKALVTKWVSKRDVLKSVRPDLIDYELCMLSAKTHGNLKGIPLEFLTFDLLVVAMENTRCYMIKIDKRAQNELICLALAKNHPRSVGCIRRDLLTPDVMTAIKSHRAKNLPKKFQTTDTTGMESVDSLRYLNQQVVDIPEFIFGYYKWGLKNELGLIKDPIVAMKIRDDPRFEAMYAKAK